MKRPDSGTVAALAATVTAVAALAVAVWDNVQSRAYNRVSVRPYLVLEVVNRTDNGEYTISNQGVGPAVIREMRIRLADEDGDTAIYGTWSEVAGHIRDRGYTITGWSDLVPGRPVGVDHTFPLLSFRIARPDSGEPGPEATSGAETASDVQGLFEALDLEVDYASVYGEPFTATSP